MTPLRGRLVRMPVPPVRPLLRRTIKRFVRLLPSLLLLLFVISLIFVTLMQIAVIHTHRRLQRNQNQVIGGSAVIANQSLPQSLHNGIESQQLSPTTQSSNRRLPSRQPSISGRKMVSKTGQPNGASTKKAEVLRIEALLDKNLPSIEANHQVLQNLVNLGRIRQIIDYFAANPVLNVSSIVSRLDLKAVVIGRTANQSIVGFPYEFDMFSPNSLQTNNESKSLLTFDHSSDDRSVDHFHSYNNESNFAIDSNTNRIDSSLVVTKPYKSKPICSSVPPKLVGRVRIESHIRIDDNMTQIVRMNPELNCGGFWEPKYCYARHRVAVIIPFRDRKKHLSILLYHLHPILKRQLLSYKVYVIEQFGNDTFNKGVLMNAGVQEALKENEFHCFVFHDVDLIPEDDRNLYSCPFAPRHMSVAVDKFNYSLPYPDLVGGVLSITKNNFVLVNGYSNLYWGWGGEDDDMAHRLKFHNLHIIRPPESIGRYTMIKHNHRPESPNNVRSALLRMAKRRAFRDGLGSVRYKVIFKHYERCYTHIMVEIGHIHKWHFPSPNKLVLHFR